MMKRNSIREFSLGTLEHLLNYVYILVDPRSSSIFYIGRGEKNRVFNHFDEAEKGNESIKCKGIRSIWDAGQDVEIVIVRHGLTKKQAIIVESVLIQLFEKKLLPNEDITNIQGGEDGNEFGWMAPIDIELKYCLEEISSIDSNCVIFNINKSYNLGDSFEKKYSASKETWIINKSRIQDLEYVLAEWRGKIVEVFQVGKNANGLDWYQKERPYLKGSKREGNNRLGWGFNGSVAPEEIRKRYFGKSIAALKPHGTQNSVYYSETLKKWLDKK